MATKVPGPPDKIPFLSRVTQPSDEPFIEAARALIKASFLLVNRSDRPYLDYDLTFAQFDVLVTLARAEGSSLTCSEIAERTLITKGGITGLLDRLEARGLVKRMPSPEDRRSVLVRLSAKGVDLFRKLYPQQVQCTRSPFEAAFNSGEMEQFRTLLRRLVAALEG